MNGLKSLIDNEAKVNGSNNGINHNPRKTITNILCLDALNCHAPGNARREAPGRLDEDDSGPIFIRGKLHPRRPEKLTEAEVSIFAMSKGQTMPISILLLEGKVCYLTVNGHGNHRVQVRLRRTEQ